MESNKRRWWKEAVVYQVYPRSYQDSNGDGIGDLRGLVTRLDYICDLGVDVIWLNPIYDSPNFDNGYDIRDYRAVHPDFGNMQDFDLLMEEAGRRGLRVLMDLVVNHCSSEHLWFREACTSRENPYFGYFHWWPAEKGEPPKRFSYFDPEGDAWTYVEAVDAWYLHYFADTQPDLNWENPRVREEVYDLMRFWLDKGVCGFRMDVISFISKDPAYPELPEAYNGDFITYYAEGPRLHEYLREMNDKVLSHYDCMTVGETPGVHLDKALDFVGSERRELQSFFHFDLMTLDREGDEVFWMRKDRWSLPEFKQVHSLWDARFAEDGWGSIYLGNHDFPRALSRWGDDSPEFRYHSATLLATFILTMRGTPYIYYGEEIGMTNIRFESLDDYRDINTHNRLPLKLAEGFSQEEFIENEKEAARDNARTPMQWNAGDNAGFSDGQPWLSVNPNSRKGLNVAAQEAKPDSILQAFRELVRLRKEHPEWVYDSYRLLWPEHPHIYAYTRGGDASFLVLLNFRSGHTEIPAEPAALTSSYILLRSNYGAEGTENGLPLRPWEARIYKKR